MAQTIHTPGHFQIAVIKNKRFASGTPLIQGNLFNLVQVLSQVHFNHISQRSKQDPLGLLHFFALINIFSKFITEIQLVIHFFHRTQPFPLLHRHSI